MLTTKQKRQAYYNELTEINLKYSFGELTFREYYAECKRIEAQWGFP